MNPLIVGLGTLAGAGALFALTARHAEAAEPTSYALPRPGWGHPIPGHDPREPGSGSPGCQPPPPLPATFTDDLSTLHPQFAAKVRQLLSRLEARGFRPRVHTAWRSPVYQQELLRQGKTRTDFSFHNVVDRCGHPKGLAVDVIDRRWAWDDAARRNGFWAALRQEAQAVGLHAPFDWDPAHVQAYSQGQNMLAQLRGGNVPAQVSFAGAAPAWGYMGGYELEPAFAGCSM